jgi:hypothetical protein
MAATTLHRQRVDEAGWHGWVYNIAMGDQRFHIRVYDELPSRAIVWEPVTARQSPVGKHVVGYLLSQGFREVQFYFGGDGLYRTVDLETLEFL